MFHIPPMADDVALSMPLPAHPLRWLYLDLNSYFASVEQQLDPSLRGRPVAVVPVETDATCAIAASYEAKAYGIKTGTPVWEAKRLCPQLVCILAEHEKYVQYHTRIKEEVERHLPVTMVCSIDEVACRLMDNEQAPEVITTIARNIKRGIRDNVGAYLRSSIGIAANRYLAKVASDMEKPDGLTLLQAHDIFPRLAALELRDLPGVAAGMEARLSRGGIYTMRDLLALSPRELRKVWGSVWGERMWHYLRGHEVPEQETTRGSVGHSHVLGPEHRPMPEARIIARRLTLKAAGRLRRLGFISGVLSLSVRIERGPRWSGEARAVRAQDNQTFLWLLEALWQQMARETGHAPLKKVSVTLWDLQPLASRTATLFDAQPHTSDRRRITQEKLGHTLDGLNQKYGRDTVLQGLVPRQGKVFSGTKVAFTRIPDVQEFRE